MWVCWSVDIACPATALAPGEPNAYWDIAAARDRARKAGQACITLWLLTGTCHSVCVFCAVEDLMRLVQASATSPELQARLRDTLNMARDTDKWKKLTTMLSEKVRQCAQRSKGTALPLYTDDSTVWCGCSAACCRAAAQMAPVR